MGWSTHAVAARAVRDLWRDAIGPSDGGIETLADSRPLCGTFATRALGGYTFVRFKSTGHAIARSETAGSAPTRYFLVSLQVGGGAQLIQGNRKISVGDGSGAIGFVNLARAFELRFPADVERVFFFVPRAALRAWAPWLEQAEAGSLARDNPLAGILAAYMHRIGDPRDLIDDRATLVLLDGFVGALALAISLQRELAAEGGRNGAHHRLVAIQALMRNRLGDPALSPAVVAMSFGISTRTVHKLFEASGSTFSAWLLAQRLEACAAVLESNASGVRIADTAFAAGFNDLSHFNRNFKARYGMAPRQWRRRGVPI